MRKTKKIAALVLAMVMAFSLMAVTAAAYGGEDHEHVCSEEMIQPRIPAKACPYCRQGMAVYRQDKDQDGRFVEFKCMNSGCENYDKAPIKVYW